MDISKSTQLQRADGKCDFVRYEFDGTKHYAWVWGPFDNVCDLICCSEKVSDMRDFFIGRYSDAPGLPSVLTELGFQGAT